MGMVLSILAQCHVPCSQCPVAHVTMPEMPSLHLPWNFQMGKWLTIMKSTFAHAPWKLLPGPICEKICISSEISKWANAQGAHEWENCLCPSIFLPCPGPTLINQIVFGREFCCGFRHALKIKTCKWGAVWIEKL